MPFSGCFRQPVVLIILEVITAVLATRIQPVFDVEHDFSSSVQRCFNVGSQLSDGPFEADSAYVYYIHQRNTDIVKYSEPVEATRYQTAFQEQRKSSTGIHFVVRVPPESKYKFSFGLAQMEDCIEGQRVLSIRAGNITRTSLDSTVLVGCQRAHFVVLLSVEPSTEGYILSSLYPTSGEAALAVFCITRSGVP